MMIKIPESDLLALLGQHGEHWVQGSWGDTDAMCLHGAIRRCASVKGDAYLIEQVANRKGWGTSWNDDEATSWADVRARLSRVEVTDDDLADTFGPQWESIVALVRRAAVLTADEAKQLDAAWAATGDAAGDAAWAAARDAAWDAARGAAWCAAQGAAWALAVRDLIDQHGFTQAHYDTLTGPWASVIGPVHPDDAVIKP